MTKSEVIQSTGYTEKGLIDLALTMAMQQAREWRNHSDDIESWDHYENLMNGFRVIFEERQNDGILLLLKEDAK